MLQCSIQGYDRDSLIWVKQVRTPNYGASG